VQKPPPFDPPSIDVGLIGYVDSCYPSDVIDFEAAHRLADIMNEAGAAGNLGVASAARCEYNVMSLISREDTLDLVVKGTGTSLVDTDIPYLERRAAETPNPLTRARYRLALTYGNPRRERGEAAVDAFLDAVAHYRNLMAADVGSAILVLDNIIPLLYRLSRRNGGYRMSEVIAVVLDAISSSPPTALMLRKKLVLLALDNKANFPAAVLEPLIPIVEQIVGRSYLMLAETIKEIADLGRRLSMKLNRKDGRMWDQAEVSALERRLAADRNPLVVEMFGSRASALNRALGNEERRTEIEADIRAAVASQELHEFSSSVDITETVEYLTKRTRELADDVGGVGILSYLAVSGEMLVDRAAARKLAEEFAERFVFRELANVAKRDTDGRIVAHYDTPEEKRRHDYLEQYGHAHRLMSMLSMKVVVGTAVRSGDLAVADFEKLLAQSWIGEAERLDLGAGRALDVRLPDLLLPSIGRYLDVVSGEAARDQLVLVVDSLAPKFETLVRNLAKRIGIPWTKDETDGSGRVTMQIARLEWLLAHAEIRKFLGEDLYEYLDFVLFEPLGDSSRTKVAHGMLFAPEYDLERAHALVLGLLRLAALTPPALSQRAVETPEVATPDGVLPD
jgi:hypothetical protein